MRKLVAALALAAAGAVLVLPGAAVTATGGPHWGTAGSAPAASAVINPGSNTVLSTADNPINGFWNQGWWSTTDANGNSNVNYIAGSLAPARTFRDYFTFDITALNPSRCPLRSATLNVERGTGSGAAVLNYQLFEVTTDPVALSDKGLNPNAAIFTDLGDGPVYGSYNLPTTGGPNFNLALNATGIAALVAAVTNGDQWFTVGGSLVPQPVAGDVYLMGFTGSTPATLTVNWPILCRIRPPA
jgi:hypothetical protein